MDDNSLLHEKSSGFSKLTHEALVEISSRLDGKSLAKLQLVNKQTWSAAGDNAAWRCAYQREFPYHYQCENKRQRTSWHSAYCARQKSEKKWENGVDCSSSATLYGHHGPVLGLAFLEDPLPENLLFTGSLHEASGYGKFLAYELDRNKSTSTPESLNVESTANSKTFKFSGVMSLAQLPSTRKIVVTTMTPQILIVELEVGSSACDLSDCLQDKRPVDRNVVVKYTPLFSLVGHQACSPMARASKNVVFTASFDSTVKMFQVPTSKVGESQHGCEPLEPVQAAETFSDDPAHDVYHGRGFNIGVSGLAISECTSRMVTGGNDMQIKLWDVASKKIIQRSRAGDGWPWNINAMDAHLNEVAVSSTDGCIRIWDFRSGQQTFSLNLSQWYSGDVYPISSVLPRIDGRYLVVGSFDSMCYVVDRRMPGRVTCQLRGHQERVGRLALREDLLVSGSFDSTVKLWDFS